MSEEVALLYHVGNFAAGFEGEVGLVEFDAVISEGHEALAEATRHPVERGVDVSDHVRPQPRTLEIVGVTSDYPIYPASEEAKDIIAGEVSRLRRMELMQRLARVGGPTALLAPNPDSPPRLPALPNIMEPRPRAVLEELERLRRKGQPVKIVTRLVDYPRMVIEGLSFRRTASSGNALEVSISLIEVVTAGSQIAEIPAHLLRPADMGRQAAKGATEGQAKEATGRLRSLGHQLFFD